jgi:PiT family inorganic phosphate transporter
MVLAWLLTLPAAGAVGGLAAWVASFGGLGEVVVFLGLLGMVGAILTRARRSPVTAHNVNEPVPVPVAA